jgi:hypothetical protein
MAFAMSSGSAALLLAYCVTGLSVWTIDNGIAGRTVAKRIGSAAADARVPVFDEYLKAAMSDRSGEQIHSQHSEASSTDDATGKREELRELRRRAVRAFMVVTLLENSKTKQLD